MGDATKAPGIDALINAVVELVQIKEKPESRGGPLVVAGRLYLSLTLILVGLTSASTYLDAMKGSTPPDCSVVALRFTVLLAVVAGLVICVITIYHLWNRSAAFIFSPTEFSAQVQQSVYTPPTPGGSASGGQAGPPPSYPLPLPLLPRLPLLTPKPRSKFAPPHALRVRDQFGDRDRSVSH